MKRKYYLQKRGGAFGASLYEYKELRKRCAETLWAWRRAAKVKSTDHWTNVYEVQYRSEFYALRGAVQLMGYLVESVANGEYEPKRKARDS